MRSFDGNGMFDAGSARRRPPGVWHGARGGVFAAGGGGEPEGFAYSERNTTANTLSHTFEDVPIGTAADNRVVVVGITCGYSTGGNGWVTAVTIGGVTAREIIRDNDANYRTVSLWWASVPTGSTADIAITRNDNISGTIVCDTWYGYPLHATPAEATSESGTNNVTLREQVVAKDGAIIMCGSDVADNWSLSWEGSESINDHGNTGENIGADILFSADNDTPNDLVMDPEGAVGLDTVGAAVVWRNYSAQASFLEAKGSATNEAETTFSDMDFGEAAEDRVLIAAVLTDLEDDGVSHTLTGITIGGVAATIAIQNNPGVDFDRRAIIAYAEVPTGTSGDVVVTLNKATDRKSVHLYRAVGLSSTTPHDTSVSGSNSTTIDVPAKGFAIGAYCVHTTGTVNWTNLTKRSQLTVGGTKPQSSASRTFSTAQEGLTVSTNDIGFEILAVASWS